MPTIVVTELQRQGGLSGWGVYDMHAFNKGGVHYGLGRESCPEGAVWSASAGKCVCRSGRVWAPGNAKCVSPQSHLITGAQPVDRGTTGAAFSQQELSAGARRYIERMGHTIRCKIDDRWAAGPQGGDPSRVCSIDGGAYKFGAYAINANPRSVITSLARSQAIRTLEAQGVDPHTLEGNVAVSNLTNAISAANTAALVASGGGGAVDPGSVVVPTVIATPGYVPPVAADEGAPSSGGGGGGMVYVDGPDTGGGFDFSQSFGAPVDIGGTDVPVWALIAAAAGAAFMLSKK